MNSEPQPPQTLHELFQRLGLQLRCYDIGRRIQPLPNAVWQDFESMQRPYPLPYMRHAWLALVIDDGTEQMLSNPMLWFIRLPLDELSQLEPGSRQLFMGAILHRLGRQMEQLQIDGNSVDLLEDNPFIFTPADDRLCQFHAVLRADLALPPSPHQEAALTYLRHCQDEAHRDDWQQLELAGLADVATRPQEHHALLIESISNLPLPALAALCQGLENRTVNASLSKVIEQRIRHYLQQSNTETALISALLRGLSQSTELILVRELIIDLLNDDKAQSLELLATISSRLHLLLTDPEICRLFLERLANQPTGNTGFKQLVSELLSLNTLKPTLIRSLNANQRSKKLISAVNDLLASARKDN